MKEGRKEKNTRQVSKKTIAIPSLLSLQLLLHLNN